VRAKFLWAGLLLGFCACTHPQQHLVSAPVAEAPGAKHFLWKVSNGQNSSWLLGSIHMAPPSLYPLSPVIENAFRSAQALGVEINIGEDSTIAETQQEFVRNGVYSKGDNLANHISAPLLARIDSLCLAWDLPVSGMHTLKPWFLTIRLSAVAIEQTGIEAGQGIDLHFMQAADSLHKEVIPLETVSQQVSVFRDMEDSLQEPMLQWTIAEAADVKSMVDSMFIFWRTGDTLGMARLVQNDNEDPRFTRFYERLYTERNQRMADKVERFLKQGQNVFVVIGSAHLVGDDNVLKLLRQKGYRVEQY